MSSKIAYLEDVILSVLNFIFCISTAHALGGNFVRHLNEWQTLFSPASTQTFMDRFNKKNTSTDHFQNKFNELSKLKDNKTKQQLRTISELKSLGYKIELFLKTDSELAFPFLINHRLDNIEYVKVNIDKIIEKLFKDIP